MRVRSSFAYAAIPIALTLVLIGCSQDGQRGILEPSHSEALATAGGAAEARVVIPFAAANFVGAVQNPFLPLVPGTILTYRQETPEGVEINTVEVTNRTKVILGVTTYVVHDQVFLEGALSEDTFDWMAPDKDGNVWYFGEDTKELGPPVSTQGSWVAGQNGAMPGILMLAHPKVGNSYVQEDAPGVVADQGKVMDLNATVTVPYGTFTNCIKTQESTPIEPGDRAFKVYAEGIGTVVEIPNKSAGRVELIAVQRP
ncbi:MAG TPA: hypothetical protein VFR25_00670 [Candidatus Eisenbacteria bacterium]|nr:hypothetical protein [Candidatus Eisenbacteria bacterium]